MKTYVYFVYLKYDDTFWQMEIDIEYKHMTQTYAYKTYTQNTIKQKVFYC
jgi:hypothetical protein